MDSTWGKSRDRISNLPEAASCHFFPPNLLWELVSYQQDGGISGLPFLILTLIMICCWIGTSLLGILEEAHGSRILWIQYCFMEMAHVLESFVSNAITISWTLLLIPGSAQCLSVMSRNLISILIWNILLNCLLSSCSVEL